MSNPSPQTDDKK